MGRGRVEVLAVALMVLERTSQMQVEEGVQMVDAGTYHQEAEVSCQER
jgi:hypothetical protein